MSRDQKKRFRSKWAKEKYQEYKEGRKHSEVHRNMERSVGKYKNFDQIVKEEGGRKSAAALQGAIRYCLKCIKMGGKWIKYKSMQERLTFLYVDEEYIDEFEESFERYQIEFTMDKKDGPTSDPSPNGKKSKEAQVGGHDSG
eukprot:7350914-Pyramimonas_sp.AAC.1